MGAAIALLSQFQVILIHNRGAVGGSFGLRPISHDCIGWSAPVERLDWLPNRDVEFHLGLFHFRYSSTDENVDSGTPMCLGQDIWYGE
jgi:hypothetical protein